MVFLSFATNYTTLLVYEDIGLPNSKPLDPSPSKATFTFHVVAIGTLLVCEDIGLPRSKAIGLFPSETTLALCVVGPLSLPLSNSHI